MITLPDVADVVVRDLLLSHAHERPDDLAATFEDGTSWTRRDACDAACASAQVLAEAGVSQGDRVAVALPNGADFLRAIWGIAMLGAIAVPVNTAFRGETLAHLLRTARPAAIVTSPDFLPRVLEIPESATSAHLVAADLRGSDTRVPPLARPLRLTDTHLMVLTSGTTGPSKLSTTSYLQTYLGGSYLLVDRGYGCGDTVLVDLPMFHLAIGYKVATSLVAGCTLAVRSQVDLPHYWEVLRDTGADVAVLVGSLLPHLSAQPSRPAEREHRLRTLMIAPAPRGVPEFCERFGIGEVVTGYGATELPVPIRLTADDDIASGTCGRLRDGFEARLVDEHDDEVPEGSPGRLIIRADHPGMIATEYFGRPEATATAWRDGWFRIGDLFRRDDEGRYYYMDRDKDSLRRRGENISSTEVEAHIAAYPDVVEVACVPAEAEQDGEQEVKVWVMAAPGTTIDPASLFEWAVTRMPYFMLPRFIEQVADLPRTPTQKVQKYLLRERGNSDATWDRAAHGYRVNRAGATRHGRPIPGKE